VSEVHDRSSKTGSSLGDASEVVRRIVQVGGLTRSELESALAEAGVCLNASAEILLADPLFASDEAETATTVEIVESTLGQLGLAGGATLPQVLAVAREQDLLPCAPFVAPCSASARTSAIALTPRPLELYSEPP
jgi:hypothetical protein